MSRKERDSHNNGVAEAAEVHLSAAIGFGQAEFAWDVHTADLGELVDVALQHGRYRIWATTTTMNTLLSAA